MSTNKFMTAYHVTRYRARGGLTMTHWGWTLLLLVACSADLQPALGVTGLRIGSFNTGGFSEAKSLNTDFMDVFIQIIQRYDIIFLQEIRDSTGNGMANLDQALNNQYGVEISIRLGGSSKEQYAFLYRKNAGISVVGIYQLPDPNDDFVKEPFSVYFHSTTTVLTDFVLVGLRAETTAVEAELNKLDEARSSVEAALQQQQVIMMGDWHADCSSLSQSKLDALDLRNDSGYSTWLIPDTADTTVGSSNCAYDRIVVSGIDITSAFVGSSWDVFVFDSSPLINMGTLMGTDIADNYPVELELQASGGTTTSGITTAAGTTSTAPPPANSLGIAAFNVQVFGTTKASKPHVMDILAMIFQRYDIIFMQEIRDATFSVLPQLNATIQTPGKSYTYVNSTRLGRTSSKEQYAYFYRTDIGLTLQETYQEPDPTDLFKRPPYAARFLYMPTGTTDQVEFFLLGIHTKPSDTFAEINGLDEVRGNLSSTQKWGLTKSIILGDLNADCSYLSQTATDSLDLRNDGSIWLIDDDVDTTVATSSCAYDRFIATPDVMANVQPLSYGVFRFDIEYGLNMTTTEEFSDHYPIELVLVP